MLLKGVLNRSVLIYQRSEAISREPCIDFVENWEEKPELIACAATLSPVDRHSRVITGERWGHCAGCD